MIVLYSLISRNKHREAVIAVNGFARGNGHFLVRDHIFQLCIVLNDGILHDQTILEFCAFSDLDTSKEDTVFHFALDDTAVSYHGIADLGVADIAGRVIIADLGINRSVAEQLVKIAIF